MPISKYYRVELNKETETLHVGFGQTTATNDILVPHVLGLLGLVGLCSVKGELGKFMGLRLKVNGAMSAPIVSALTHRLSHVVKYIAIFDPKMGGYVVTVSHQPGVNCGDIIH